MFYRHSSKCIRDVPNVSNQSSTLDDRQDLQSWVAFDGNTKQVPSGWKMYTHTSLQTDPWIEVDLQRKTLIISVKIYNWLDSDAIKHSTNLHNGFIYVFDLEDSLKNSKELCASFYKIEAPT